MKFIRTLRASDVRAGKSRPETPRARRWWPKLGQEAAGDEPFPELSGGEFEVARRRFAAPWPATAVESGHFQLSADPVSAARPEPRRGACLLTVCTVNHLHFARALLESWDRYHPELPAYVVVADWDGRSDLELGRARPLAGCAIVGSRFPFMALKYNAADLCCALKPYGLRYLLDYSDFADIVYLDSDIYLFAPVSALLGALESSPFVVTPHVLEPLPNQERFWERPTQGDLAYAGILNAGLFAMRVGEESARFVTRWLEMVTAPGAFLHSLGGQMEQNSFNWVTGFVDGVHVLRDPSYNVAYWNLPRRGVRCSALDGDTADPPRWTVDGSPLVAFHFSGFSPSEPARISRYDSRLSLYILPSVARLFEFYYGRLIAHGSAETSQLTYRFDRFPTGIPIDARMRRIFKEQEIYWNTDLDPWTLEGEAYYCRSLLSPAPSNSSLIPVLFEDIYASRSDLWRMAPHARSHPDLFLAWIARDGIAEYGYREIFDRHRPSGLNGEALPRLAGFHSRHPELFDGLRRPLREDRPKLLDRLAERADLREFALELRSYSFERYRISDVWLARIVYEQRADLQQSFPSPLSEDAERYHSWLREFGTAHCLLPQEVASAFASRSQGRALARIYSHLSRRWDLMARWPLGLVGVESRELAMHLLAHSAQDLEFDIEDIVMFLWLMDFEPWQGLPLALELPVNARRHPSPVLEEGQEELLEPVLRTDARFRRELERYRAETATEKGKRQEATARSLSPRRLDRDPSVFAAIERYVRRRAGSLGSQQGLEPVARISAPSGPPPFELTDGVNFFGFHKSPSGLGTLTRSLHLAMKEASVDVQPITLGNASMFSDLVPGDFLRRWEPRYGTNLFVSYPHLPEMLLEAQPEHVVSGRRNIVYMAWEQRDDSPYWAEVLRGFEQVWAISDFASAALQRSLGRRVETLLPPIDFGSLPPRASKEEAGFDEEVFTFLYVFDANSSIERKNPEAAIAAFARAFSPDEPACLVLRASHADRMIHRERLSRLVRAAPPGTRLQLRFERMEHRRLLQLLSAADCYLSLHRAEGFGYTCAEAMAYARPVIASAYSGNLDFMNDENAFLVRCGECAVEVADGPFQRGSVWAEPDVDHAAGLMREVFEKRFHATAVGCRASVDVRRLLSPGAAGARLLQLLGDPGANARSSRGEVSPFARRIAVDGESA